MSALEHAGVGPGYVHHAKLARPGPSVLLGGTVLKWYDVAPEDEPVRLAVRALARRALQDGVHSGEIPIEGDTGFVILHRCGESFHFLLVSTWRNDNELWETVWAKDADGDSFGPWDTSTGHRPTFCVWELGVVAHERDAWSRYLESGRDDDAHREYLRDCYIGSV